MREGCRAEEDMGRGSTEKEEEEEDEEEADASSWRLGFDRWENVTLSGKEEDTWISTFPLV